MWIPDPIYKRLPLIYAAAGLAIVPCFGANGPSLVSAALLVLAGGLTAWWRFQHRDPVAAPPDPASTLKDEWAERRARRERAMRALGQ